MNTKTIARADAVSLVTTRTERGIECMYEDETLAIITQRGVTWHVQSLGQSERIRSQWFFTRAAAEYYALVIAIEHLALDGRVE